MDFLNQFEVPVIVGTCLCVGFVVKKWIKDVDNKYIPTIVSILGVVLACWMEKMLSPEILLQGLFSGLSSTGLYELLKQYLGGSKNE